MSKSKPIKSAPHPGQRVAKNPEAVDRGGAFAGLIVVGCVLLTTGVLIFSRGDRAADTQAYLPSPQVSVSSNRTQPAVPAPVASSPSVELPKSEVKSAVMVTMELDFGGQVPSIANGLKQVERRHQPADGVGRVFSILDAYGEPTADGRKLHVSMHVSLEKTGVGSLVFKPTGEILWSSRIVPAADGATNSTPNGLIILFENGAGRLLTVDGSTSPASIMQAGVKGAGLPVEHIWPEGAEREISFLYSACGCPVKVMGRRQAGRIVRTTDRPVIFPDDPAVLEIIHRLMEW